MPDLSDGRGKKGSQEQSWKLDKLEGKLLTVTIKSLRIVALICFVLFLLVGIALAAVMHETLRYERPLRAVRGRVTAFGQVMPVVWVDVYDNAQVCLDDSLSPGEKRERQTRIATVEPDADGRFEIKNVRKGFYELEFGNRGNGGYNVLSVLVNVDPKGTRDSLCVDLSLEGGAGQNSVGRCGGK